MGEVGVRLAAENEQWIRNRAREWYLRVRPPHETLDDVTQQAFVIVCSLKAGTPEGITTVTYLANVVGWRLTDWWRTLYGRRPDRRPLILSFEYPTTADDDATLEGVLGYDDVGYTEVEAAESVRWMCWKLDRILDPYAAAQCRRVLAGILADRRKYDIAVDMGRTAGRVSQIVQTIRQTIDRRQIA